MRTIVAAGLAFTVLAGCSSDSGGTGAPTTGAGGASGTSAGAGSSATSATASDLGLAANATFYVSIAAVDAAGHESLFAYPEYRCTTGGCAVPQDALDVTAMR